MRAKPLILVVDDEHALLEILSAKFAAAGFDPVVAYSAKEGVDAAQKLHPDIVLMDIHMPGGETGTDAALQITQNAATKDVKVAFLSSLKDPWPKTLNDRDGLAKDLGMVDFIDKTADLNVIVEKVRGLLAAR